jgi:hypothetical protein
MEWLIPYEELADDEGVGLGTCMYELGSRVPHSCAPNLSYTLGKKVQFRYINVEEGFENVANLDSVKEVQNKFVCEEDKFSLVESDLIGKNDYKNINNNNNNNNNNSPSLSYLYLPYLSYFLKFRVTRTVSPYEILSFPYIDAYDLIFRYKNNNFLFIFFLLLFYYFIIIVFLFLLI